MEGTLLLVKLVEMRMIGWRCSVSLKERQPITELRRRWRCDEKMQTEVAWTWKERTMSIV